MTGLLLALVFFQIKHYLADYQWQTAWMIDGKRRYLGLGGLAHAGMHGLLSLPPLLVAGASPLLAVAIALLEVALHHHIDWSKARFVRRLDLDTESAGYWRAFGLDQAAHQLTYVGMLWITVLLSG